MSDFNIDEIIEHNLHCLDDMCDARHNIYNPEYCRICIDAFRRGYDMRKNQATTTKASDKEAS